MAVPKIVQMVVWEGVLVGLENNGNLWAANPTSHQSLNPVRMSRDDWSLGIQWLPVIQTT